MRKKTVYELEWDEDDEQLNDVAFLLFHSVAPSYAFVDDLNKLYGLGLSRIGDMPLYEALWPMFSQHDALHRIDYYIVERPTSCDDATTLWTPGHKMLIVKGEGAQQCVEAIHEEFCSARPADDPTDLLATEHAERLAAMLASFTTTTIVAPEALLSPTLSKKAQREQGALRRMLDDILDYLDM